MIRGSFQVAEEEEGKPRINSVTAGYWYPPGNHYCPTVTLRIKRGRH